MLVDKYSGVKAWASEMLRYACTKTQVSTNIYDKILDNFPVNFDGMPSGDVIPLYENIKNSYIDYYNTLERTSTYYVNETILYSIVISCMDIIYNIYVYSNQEENIWALNYNLNFWSGKITKDIQHLQLEGEIQNANQRFIFGNQ